MVSRRSASVSDRDWRWCCMHDSPPETGTVRGFRRDEPGANPSLSDEGYKSTRLRHPKQPLVYLAHTVTEVAGPQLGLERVTGELDHDLTRQHEGEPLGERIVVSGRLLDGDGRPVRDSLVEIWQANAGGRYV